MKTETSLERSFVADFAENIKRIRNFRSSEARGNAVSEDYVYSFISTLGCYDSTWSAKQTMQYFDNLECEMEHMHYSIVQRGEAKIEEVSTKSTTMQKKQGLDLYEGYADQRLPQPTQVETKFLRNQNDLLINARVIMNDITEKYNALQISVEKVQTSLSERH